MGRPTQTFPTRENRRNFIIMKKETIFKHELNESIQSTAALNCLKNRNNKQVVASQEQEEEDTLNAYYSQDEPDYENDHHGIWLIINLMRKMGMLRAQGIEGRDDVDDGNAIDAAYDLIEQKLNEEGMWIGDDDHEAERFVSFFGEEIAAEAMKSALHNQEQEELPSMERHDMILALSEYMSESWIATDDEDGDLDDIYYAIADILDKTDDYPASTSWEDCKSWCQKHYKEVEARIY